MTTPDWLTRRGGKLKQASDGLTWFVLFAEQPQYALTVVPVGGTFGCAIRQTINGRRLDSPGSQPSREAALSAGLEDLRKTLGWG